MKLLTTLLPLLLAAAHCHAGQATGSAARDCRMIVSDIERLACFDAGAGTPPTPVAGAAGGSVAAPGAAAPAPFAPSPSIPDVIELVRLNEAERDERDVSFRMTRVQDQQPEQNQVVISAPALDGSAQRAYLAISCISNISRLQLLLPRPAERNQIRIRLFVDARPLSTTRTWQVMEEGLVIDAGRGLVAIELLRLLSSGGRLRVESDYAPAHGLMFDAEGLQGLVAQQREACHW
ncbi:type VI secretion system-associated protein VasI [Achromobacter spanius]|uniref:type VI secretion system-associated protein VasI n=1 Tax=Achromobacter spanius TaxID=217203 RepID=UPI00320AAB79